MSTALKIAFTAWVMTFVSYLMLMVVGLMHNWSPRIEKLISITLAVMCFSLISSVAAAIIITAWREF